MVYSNPEFFAFLAVLLPLFWLTPNYRLRSTLLIISSLFFYLWSGLFDTALFLAVVLVSWLAVFSSEHFPQWRKVFLRAGITAMLLHLFFWKYAGWLMPYLLLPFGMKWTYKLTLPVGISFFTLQGISYLIDYGRRETRYVSLPKYTLFKSFFAQLIAGPIVRMNQLLPQLEKLKRPTSDQVARGAFLFTIGFLKKTLIADSIAPFVDAAFAQPLSCSRLTLWLAAIGYTAQIWADFSGYTDMGRGAARMLGIHLPRNFLSPYLARSPSEFWKRWHITLSEWIRDYVYIPLGGRRGSIVRQVTVALATMGLSGLWHGANWTFVAWGFFHGVLLIGERLLAGLRKHLPILEKTPLVAKVVLVQFLVMLGWILFRAGSLPEAGLFLNGLLTAPATGIASGTARLAFGLSLTVFFHVFFYQDLKTSSYVVLDKLNFAFSRFSASLERRKAAAITLGVLAGTSSAAVILFALIFRIHGEVRHFIYFQF